MTPILKTAASLLLMTSLSLPLVAQSSSGQQPTKPKPPEPKAMGDKPNKKPLTSHEQRALALLDSLFDKAKEMGDEQFKIRAQAQIADALWAHDEDRARRFFTEAFRALEELKAPALESKDAREAKATAEALALAKMQLRHEITRLLASRDADLANTLLKQIKEDPATAKSENYMLVGQNDSAVYYLAAAAAIASEDPEAAAEMVRKVLRNGFHNRVVAVLLTIRPKNEALANQLFSECLMAARSNPATLASSLGVLSAYASQNEMERMFRDDPSANPARRAVLDQYLNFVYNVFNPQENPTADPAAQQRLMNDVATLKMLISLFDKFMPDKSEAMRARLNAIADRLPPAQRGLLNQEEDADGSDPQYWIKRAESASNPIQKDNLYGGAAMRIFWKQGLDAGLFAAAKISDRAIRESFIGTMRFQAGLRALTKGDLEEATHQAKENVDVWYRVELSRQVCEAWFGKKEPTRAGALLDDIETIVGKVDNTRYDGPYKARVLLEIAEMVARYDAPRGFETMQSAVKAVNAADFTPLKPEERNKTRRVFVTLEMLNFKPGLTRLARADFDRALVLAQSLEKKETLVMAQLAVCHGALNEPPAPASKDKSKAAEDQEATGKKSSDKDPDKKPPIK